MVRLTRLGAVKKSGELFTFPCCNVLFKTCYNCSRAETVQGLLLLPSNARVGQ